MLPDIETQNRGLVVHEGAILVRAAGDFELAVGDGQPRPTAAELRRRGVAEQLLELRKVTERALDGVGQGAAWLTTAAFSGGRHDRPEQRVIVMAAPVVTHRGADVVRDGGYAAQQLVDGFCEELGVFVQRG